MTDDLSALDNLRPEVRDAINRQDRQEKCDEYCPVCEDRATIRAELLRLANENANYGKSVVEQYKRGVYWMYRAKEAEAELAALKAKIEAAPLTTFRRAMLGTPHAWVEEKFACPEWIGKRVRLMVVEE